MQSCSSHFATYCECRRFSLRNMFMPSEKAKENKNLVATCAACNKPASTESMVSLRGREDGVAKSYTVCVPCANKGWRPPGFSGVYAVRPQ